MEQNGGDEKENYLAHYGVVGMRWGIRRYQPYSYTGARRSGRAGKEIGEAAKLGKKAAKAVGKGAKVAGKTVASGVKKYREYRRERKRQDLINNGTSRDLKANRGKFLTEDDVKKAIDRIKDDIILDDLARDVHMKAIKRGKEALNLTKDFLSAGWGVYSSYRQIKGEEVNRAIDKAIANNDTQLLKKLSKRTDVDRKQQKEINDLIRDYDFSKPLEKAHREGDVETLERLYKEAKTTKEQDDIASRIKDVKYRKDTRSRSEISDALSRGDFDAVERAIKEGRATRSEINDLTDLISKAQKRRNYYNNNPSTSNDRTVTDDFGNEYDVDELIALKNKLK